MTTATIQPILKGSTCAAWEFSVLDDDLLPLNLSGYGITMNFWRNRTNGNTTAPDQTFTLGSGLSVTSSVGGTAQINSQTINWQDGTYQFVLSTVDTNNNVKARMSGTWVIWPVSSANVVPPLLTNPEYVPPVLFRAKTGGSLTGTLVETKMASIEYVSGDLLALDSLEIKGWYGKTGSGGGGTLRLYLNDTDDLTTATQIATFSVTGSHRTLPLQRTMQIITTTSQRIYGTASSAINDLDAVTVNRSSLTYNLASTFYLITSAQLGNAGDTLFLDMFTAETKRP